MVPGDVNSTLAATLVAAKLGVPLAHVEAGLRSFDRTMPEEINRIVADEFSDYLFIHSDEARENLRAEGIAAERIHFVGNTMIDTLVGMEEGFRGLGVAARLGLEPGGYLLVTLHRPALVDGPMLFGVLGELSNIARELPVVFPLHPRTRSMIEDGPMHPAVHLLEPVGYQEFLSLEADSAGVLTDSGGVQEETTYLGVPCFTLRDNTERPVTVRAGTNTLLGLDPARITEIPAAIGRFKRGVRNVPPGWDGHAAERLAAVVCGEIPHGERALARPAESGVAA
jgi:UDP-N-acetylglucosamine 2-epimerase (non-hydrolysing)